MRNIVHLISGVNIGSGNAYIAKYLSLNLHSCGIENVIAATSDKGFHLLRPYDDPSASLADLLSISPPHNRSDISLLVSQGVLHLHSMLKDTKILDIVRSMHSDYHGSIAATVHLNHLVQAQRLKRRQVQMHWKPTPEAELTLTHLTGKLAADSENYYYQRQILPYCDILVHLTNIGREMMVSSYWDCNDWLSKERHPVIGNAIMLLDESPPFRSVTDELRILYDGRISDEKGAELLAKAFVRVVREYALTHSAGQGYTLKLVIHGNEDSESPGLLDRIKRILGPLGTKHTEFIPWQPKVAMPINGRLLKNGEDIKYHLMSTCHLLVVPSDSETFCLAVAEGMHHRIPVLASDLEVFDELYGNSIMRFNPQREGSLENFLMGFVRSANSLKVQKMVERAYRQSSRFSWDCITKDYIEQVYTPLWNGIAHSCVA
ncbi:glycosyltransferase [Candidatus Woesearchaeota archaeon]|nr:glycosyltransferase [Candidatus Woesearchaeota archaeon]